MNKLFTKVAGISLGLAMALGVGVVAAKNSSEIIPVQAAEQTLTPGEGQILYTHDFSTKPTASADNTLADTKTTTQSSVVWTVGSASNLNAYNSANYKGVQLGAKSKTGSIEFVTKYDWGSQTGTYKDYTIIKKVALYLNNGNGTISATVKVDGVNCTSSGTVGKNSSATSQRDGTSKIEYTPAANHDTGKITISYSATSGGGYFCAIQVLCEQPAVPQDEPNFALDKNSVELTLGGSSTTVTATPNEHVSGSASYSWSRTAGDDCVTLTNANTATVTIEPKGTAPLATCTLTVSVTGCTSKNVQVTVEKISTIDNPLSVDEAIAVMDKIGDGEVYQRKVFVIGTFNEGTVWNSSYSQWEGTLAGTSDNIIVKATNDSGTSIGTNNGDADNIECIITGYIELFNSNYQLSYLPAAASPTGSKFTPSIVQINLPDLHSITTSTVGLTLSESSVASNGMVTLTTAAKKKGTNIVVGGTATTSISGNVVSLSEVQSDITINATIVDAEVASLALQGQTTKFGLGASFSFDGTVTGTYDDWVSPHTSETIASGYTVDSSEVDMNAEGTYEVTVSFGGASASYNVKVAELFDNTKGEYHKVTSLNQLYDGAHIAIVDADEEYSMLNGFTSTNNVTATSITADATTNTISKTNVLDIELVKTNDNEYRFKLDDDLYLYAASSSSNHLKAASLSTSGDNGKFAITLSAGAFTIIAQGDHTRSHMRFNPNNGSPVFACYASTSELGTPAIYVFETYQAEAKKYAEAFIKGNGSANTCEATMANWTSLGTAFGSLTDGAKDIFKKATHNAAETYTNPSEYTVEHAVARYDDALLKHSELRTNEFMGRVAQGTLVYGSAFLKTDSLNSNNGAIIITISSVVGLTAVGAYFLLRKKKHQ